VEEDDPREKLRDHSGRLDSFLREDWLPVESKTWCRTAGTFDRGRSDEKSGRPVQLGGKRHQKQEPTTETRRT
jgi:hypothetical protein